ncbi:MAG: hypothetical protein RLZZ241_895 [Bacteroidota bacterium]|jgi:hypothetical protein
MKTYLISVLMILGLFTGIAQEPQLKRTIVTTDGEIDDVDTFIRMLLYSNEFELQGLVYSSSMWHYKGDGKGTMFTSEMEWTKRLYGMRTDLRWPGTAWIEDLLEGYAAVYPNLMQHSKRYPSPEKLHSLIRIGNIDFEGEMEKRTDGSQLIREVLLDDDERELFLQAWGGTNTIARALKSIEEDYKDSPQWPAIQQKVSQKAIIYTILDQDATYKNYIGPNWPEIRVFYNANQFWSFAYAWKRVVPPSQQPFLEGSFMGANIIRNHGPLLEKYYSYGDGQKQEGDPNHFEGDMTKIINTERGSFGLYDFISEGDSPAFLHLVDVGLDNYEDPSRGGWSGRFELSADIPNRYEDGEGAADFNPESGELDKNYPQTRWIKAMQLDFAARADWCVLPFDAANHPPVISLPEGNRRLANPGDQFSVQLNTSDPDNHPVGITAWSYAEAGDGKIEVSLDGNALTVSVPEEAKAGSEFHVIVEGTDTGFPALTRYSRLIITIR